MAENRKYQDAKRHVASIKGFYIHLAVFAAVMTGLIALDFTDAKPWWVQWPFIGWGLGILGHAYLVFGTRGHPVSDWEKRKIREKMGQK